MSHKITLIKFFKFVISIFIAACLVIIVIHYFYKAFPPETHKTDANVLLVEGWLPSRALQDVKNEFQNNEYDIIIVTGLTSSNDYFKLSQNGYLVFYPVFDDASSKENSIHKIEVQDYSEMGGNESAHFNVYINNNRVSDFNASMKKRKHAISWQGKLEDIDSIMVQFDNDKYSKWEDVNLYVKEIIIDHKFVIHYRYNSAYDVGEPDWKQRRLNNYFSNAEQTRLELIRIGIDSSRIRAVPGTNTQINRTLRSVVTFREWLSETGYHVKGINLISSGLHAKRKHMIYKSILAENYDVGIICLPDYRRTNKIRRTFNELREFFGSVYYWVVLKGVKA